MHGLMLTCRRDVDMFTRGRIVLSLPKRAHVDWNWPISGAEKISKNRLVCKNAVGLLTLRGNKQARVPVEKK